MINPSKYKEAAEALLHYSVHKAMPSIHLLDLYFCKNTLMEAFEREYENEDHLVYGIKDAMKAGVFETSSLTPVSEFFCNHIESIIGCEFLRLKMEEAREYEFLKRQMEEDNEIREEEKQ